MDATIVIPTKNGGKLFEKVLTAVFTQETTYSYEVICVDSGSKDGTVETTEKFPAKLFEIPPTEFGHGRTRNFGAAQGSGRYIVFITQDALPANKFWLQNLLESIELDEKTAGAFGQHLPYPDCNIFDKRDLPRHFARFGNEPHVFCIEDRVVYDADVGLRLFLSFFSDNNSCLRRSVWEKYPYDDVDFAEDQIWMRKMLEKGYKKAYAPNSLVYHSHNFAGIDYAKRVFDDLRGHYVMHDGFRMIPTFVAAINHILSSLREDLPYIKSLNLGAKRTVSSIWLALQRDFGRGIGGYLGSNYYEYPMWLRNILDQRASQQYQQLRE